MFCLLFSISLIFNCYNNIYLYYKIGELNQINIVPSHIFELHENDFFSKIDTQFLIKETLHVNSVSAKLFLEKYNLIFETNTLI